ncbi:MAG: dephospho-CoA kinase [Bacteroides sp.]|nr:dephospho-CoA kinase [Bacteroides sp.]
MEATVFNPAQQHLLQMMSHVNTPEALAELDNVISAYFAEKVDEEMDALWKEGEITLDTIEQWGKEHMRTPYK